MAEAGNISSDPIVRRVNEYKKEASEAKKRRMDQNSANFEVYHLRQDWSHKVKGQSREFLPKQSIAVEQMTSLLQQGLMDQAEWFDIQPEDGVVAPLIEAREVSKLLDRQLKKNKFPEFVADSIKVGALGSLMICKVSTKRVPVNKFVTEDQIEKDKVVKKLIRKEDFITQLSLDVIRQEDWYPDPTGSGLYECQDIEMDYYELLRVAKENPDIYDLEAVKSLQSGPDEMQTIKQARETDQVTTDKSYRKRIVLTECWGTILDDDGEVLHENCVTVIANESVVIAKPRPNPFWHGKSPFVVCPLLRVPHSVWHKAVMDAPTELNKALNEQFNLMFDASMMSVWGIKQLREHWLENTAQVNEGIAPGTTLSVNSSCPPGAQVLERIDTGALSQEALSMFNITSGEFNQGAFTNDLRLGALPSRAVKATEVVAANQTISGVFNGIVKIVESEYIGKILDLSWQVMAQHMDDLDSQEVRSIIGKERAFQLASFSAEERFAGTALGHKFRVFGLSTVMNKINDFRKITALLQTVASSPVLVQEFSKKYSFTKLMGEIVRSLDIDEDKLMLDKEAAQENQEGSMSLQDLLQGMMGGQPGGSQGDQSQIMQAGSARDRGANVGPEKMVVNQQAQ